MGLEEYIWLEYLEETSRRSYERTKDREALTDKDHGLLEKETYDEDVMGSGRTRLIFQS